MCLASQVEPEGKVQQQVLYRFDTEFRELSSPDGPHALYRTNFRTQFKLGQCWLGALVLDEGADYFGGILMVWPMPSFFGSSPGFAETISGHRFPLPRYLAAIDQRVSFFLMV